MKEKLIMEAFGDEKGGDLMFHPEKLIVPEGETFYAVMDRLRLFFVKFWEVIILSMVERKSAIFCCSSRQGSITTIWAIPFCPIL